MPTRQTVEMAAAYRLMSVIIGTYGQIQIASGNAHLSDRSCCEAADSCQNESMRKRIIGSTLRRGGPRPRSDTWLDLAQIATVEVSSEDPQFPIETVFQSDDNSGWRADQNGVQVLRLIFDEPTALHRIQLQFEENEIERTQEFTICWAPAQGGPTRDIVRQQWTFSPEGSTREVEDYDVNLEGVAVLELSIRPNLNPGAGLATLLKWRVR